MKQQFLLGATLLLIFSACEKEEITPPDNNNNTNNTIPPEDAAAYTQLAVGNYWVYQRFSIDLTTGDTTELIKLDSLYISKDTVANGDTFYVMEGKWFSIPYRRIVRNDGHKLVSLNGFTFFSTAQKQDTITKNLNVSSAVIDSIYNVTYNDTFSVNTPLGDYHSPYQYSVIFFMNDSLLSHDFDIRFETDYYAKDIGVVKYTSYYASVPTDEEMRLIRYKLN